jgi:hypothetical protein
VSRVRITLVTSALLVVLGIVITVQAALLGGSLGVLIGAMFVVAGGMRLYLLRR